jgi:phosphoglycerate dehydrogenase-like enzyme
MAARTAVAVAEHALMLMLAVCPAADLAASERSSSGIWRGNNWQEQARLRTRKARRWASSASAPSARRSPASPSAFGMNVHLFRRPPPQRGRRKTRSASRFRLFDEVLAKSDIVSLHVPLLPNTRHMIGARELGLMKPAAYLINTCRGPVVDEAALTTALQNNTIAGAGLDVFDQEPPPADNPLFKLDNVILTPHLAGPTFENRAKRFRNGFDNVQRVARGQAPFWVIPELQGLPPKA